jgi:hypothetical protein
MKSSKIRKEEKRAAAPLVYAEFAGIKILLSGLARNGNLESRDIRIRPTAAG